MDFFDFTKLIIYAIFLIVIAGSYLYFLYKYSKNNNSGCVYLNRRIPKFKFDNEIDNKSDETSQLLYSSTRIPHKNLTYSKEFNKEDNSQTISMSLKTKSREIIKLFDNFIDDVKKSDDTDFTESDKKIIDKPKNNDELDKIRTPSYQTVTNPVVESVIEQEIEQENEKDIENVIEPEKLENIVEKNNHSDTKPIIDLEKPFEF